MSPEQRDRIISVARKHLIQTISEENIQEAHRFCNEIEFGTYEQNLNLFFENYQKHRVDKEPSQKQRNEIISTAIGYGFDGLDKKRIQDAHDYACGLEHKYSNRLSYYFRIYLPNIFSEPQRRKKTKDELAINPIPEEQRRKLLSKGKEELEIDITEYELYRIHTLPALYDNDDDLTLCIKTIISQTRPWTGIYVGPGFAPYHWSKTNENKKSNVDQKEIPKNELPEEAKKKEPEYSEGVRNNRGIAFGVLNGLIIFGLFMILIAGLSMKDGIADSIAIIIFAGFLILVGIVGRSVLR